MTTHLNSKCLEMLPKLIYRSSDKNLTRIFKFYHCNIAKIGKIEKRLKDSHFRQNRIVAIRGGGGVKPLPSISKPLKIQQLHLSFTRVSCGLVLGIITGIQWSCVSSRA